MDSVALDTAQHVATHLAASYYVTPNPQVLQAAQAHAHTLLDLLARASMNPDTRTRLESIACDASCLAGDAHIGAGQFARADRWFAEALKLARPAGDHRLEAFALASPA